MKGISCAQRLSRDVAELFSSDFNCTASYLTVFQTGDTLNEPGSINLESKVFEGPYRGGRFNFCFHIPANYPFKPVEVWATHPIWHPNIDLRTGRVAVPLEWSPVLTLHAFALAVQMLMLEPSSENPLNIESFSSYISKPEIFDKQVQQSLRGGWFSGVHFQCCQLSLNEMAVRNIPLTTKRSYEQDYDEKREESLVQQGQLQGKSPHKRPRRKYFLEERSEHEHGEEEGEDEYESYDHGYEQNSFPVNSFQLLRDPVVGGYSAHDSYSDLSLDSQQQPDRKRGRFEVPHNLSDSQISLAYSRLSLKQDLMDISNPLPLQTNNHH